MKTIIKDYVNKQIKFALDSKFTIAMLHNINIKES
jgi:hypothetical protein